MGLQTLKNKSTVKRNIDWILDKTVADHLMNAIHYCGAQRILISVGMTKIGDLCVTFTGDTIDKTTEYFQDKETFVLFLKDLIS